jgi:hypothetical protein
VPPLVRRGLGDSDVVPRRLLVAAVAALAVTALASCDQGSRQERFCDKLVEEHTLLATVPTDPAQLDDFVERYEDLGDVAPLAIDEQWTTITDLVSAVATADLADPATADRLRDQAVAATKAVNEVRVYAQDTCGVDLVFASVAPATAPADPSATTLPATAPATVPPTVP